MLRARGSISPPSTAWAREVIEGGLAACSRLIAERTSPFCFGEALTLGGRRPDPQMANARRFGARTDYPGWKRSRLLPSRIRPSSASHPDAQARCRSRLIDFRGRSAKVGDMRNPSILLAASAALALAAAPAYSAPRKAAADPAAALQQRLLTLDTHLDTPGLRWRLPGLVDHGRAHGGAGDYTQVDLPRMKQGGLDGGFWAIYTPQGPLDPLRRARRATSPSCAPLRSAKWSAGPPEGFALASKAADAAAIKASGKRVVYLSIGSAWPLGDDPTLAGKLLRDGRAHSGFAHFRTNQFADSSTDKAKWNGLSPLGVQLLAV
jgi:hypothetical protein